MLNFFDGADAGDPGQFIAKGARKVGHRLEVRYTFGVDPRQKLFGAVFLLAQGRDEALQFVGGHALEVGARIFHFGHFLLSCDDSLTAETEETAEDVKRET